VTDAVQTPPPEPENPGLALIRKAVDVLRKALPQTFAAADSPNALPQAAMKAMQRETAFMSRDQRERVLVQGVCCAQLLDSLLALYEDLLRKHAALLKQMEDDADAAELEA
jgi:hypothetical protein